MCLLVIAWRAHARYRLIVAANRDEYHGRESKPLGKWPPPDGILAGRDLRAGGTWLGMDRARRFGIVTNFRELQRPNPNAPSRGNLIPDFLRGGADAGAFVARLETAASSYSGFNLLLADGLDDAPDGGSLWYASNRAPGFGRQLSSGVYGLSNEFLDSPWPKLRRVRQRFETWLPDARPDTASELFDILSDRVPAGADAELPHTGLSPEWERVLSSPFVRNPVYGTRCSTVVLLEPSGRLYVAERRFDAEGLPAGQSEFELKPNEWVAER